MTRRDFVRMTACGVAAGAALFLPRLSRAALESASGMARRFDLGHRRRRAGRSGSGAGGASRRAAGGDDRGDRLDRRATDAAGRAARRARVDRVTRCDPVVSPIFAPASATTTDATIRSPTRRGRGSDLNPGDGAVSRLCHEPRVALAVLESLLAPYISTGRLTLLLEHAVVAADVGGDRVRALTVRNLASGSERVLEAPYVHRCHRTRRPAAA